MADEKKKTDNDVEKDEGKKTEPKPKAAPKKKKEPVTTPVVVVKPGAGLTLAQFLRSEDLGFSKDGFANYIREEGHGGRKLRIEWAELFAQYKGRTVS